ncbi:MAG: hypothetical protein IJ302_08865 [Clostridia bacterium]|nr:hypothetical protein [Clostridia bacterium]
MKHTRTHAAVLWLLTAVLCLLLASCEPLLPSQITPDSAAAGITLETQFPVYHRNVEKIQFIIRNNSGETAEFGTPWYIEKYKDGTWYTVPFLPDTSWTMPLIMLADGGTTSDTAVLSMLDHNFTDGTYRILKEINGRYYAAEFTIGDAPITADAPYGYAPLSSLPENYTKEQALADGVLLDGAQEDYAKFLSDLQAGVDTQIRIAQERGDGSLFLTDITVETVLGSRRICLRTSDDLTGTYYSYFLTDGTWVLLSAFPTNELMLAAGADALADEFPMLCRIPVMDEEDDIIDYLQKREALQAASDYPVVQSGVFWSADGTKQITVFRDPGDPLSFSVNELFAGGGSAGHMTGISTPGMTAVFAAYWIDDTTVMLFCTTDTPGMTGYVTFDTAADEVLSYTQSFYTPQVVPTEDGTTVLIPE